MSRKPLLLSAEGVNKSFAGFHAIRDLNFYMEKGELRTVIGPNGAGKTTFLDLITGRTKPDTGTISWMDQTELTRLNEYEISVSGSGASSRRPPCTPTIRCTKTCCLVSRVHAGCGRIFSIARPPRNASASTKSCV